MAKTTKTPVKKVVKKVQSVKKTEVSFTVPVVDITGTQKGTLTLPKEIFGMTVSDKLLAQVVRVYLANKRQGGAIAQTRSEVTGSGKKVWRQKGTGRARHGERNAPIFVGGGVAHGPRPRDFSLKLSKKMRRTAFFGALSRVLSEERLIIVDDLSTLSGKTKELVSVLKAISCPVNGVSLTGSVLLATPGKVEKLYRAGRNVEKLTVTEVQKLTTYIVEGSKKLVMSKAAVEELTNTFLKHEAKP